MPTKPKPKTKAKEDLDSVLTEAKDLQDKVQGTTRGFNYDAIPSILEVVIRLIEVLKKGK
jgi:hypothetical protein